MSKRINVNPDHYKVRGRERPGKDVARPGAGMNNRLAGDLDEARRKRHPSFRKTMAQAHEKPRMR